MEEEEATQPATQQIIDPRRLGQANSGLNDEDLADIFCILHPASLPAHKAAALIREQAPNHTISTQSDVKIRERNSESEERPRTFDVAAQGVISCDIVLRLSANLKDPLGGYRFGRNRQRCDFLLGRDDEVKRISNIHFRIYINEYGIIMIEDQSTNGTAVDGDLLRAKDKENGRDYRHTLEQGSIIILTMTPPEEDFRFIVRIPQRNEESEIAYRRNLTNYFHRIHNANLDRQRQTRLPGVGLGNHEPVGWTFLGTSFEADVLKPNIFATPDTGTPDPTMSNVGRYVREWRGGTKYNKVGTIGKGAFATVYKITAKFDGVPFAAKELEKRRFMKNGVLDQKVDNEMKIMKKIKHPNVVQYIEHVDWEEYLYIVMEYVPGGDLGSLIHRRGHLQEAEVKVMASQLLSALKYLHGMGITHRDVKPDNILINNFSPLHVKLTDFGLSKMVDSEETFLRTFCGTLLYCAPEVYSEYREYDHAGRRNPRGVPKRSLPPQRYDDAVDIWSLAGVLFYGLCGSPPYPVKNGTTYQELLNHIMTQPLDIRPLQLADISESGIRFVRSMLHTRPEHRATIAELENESWFGGSDSVEMSIEDDEVDMIGAGCINPRLQDGASQLSIHDEDLCQVGDSQGDASLQSVSDLTEIQREIPSSFNTDDNSNGSYGYLGVPATKNNGRLFGEVNIAALGSSGAIPLDYLPIPTLNHPPAPSEPAFSQDSIFTQSEPTNYSPRIDNGSQPSRSAAVIMTMPPPPPPEIDAKTPNINGADERAARSSSLMGAESLVGQLNMHSPVSTASPFGDVSVSQATNIQDAKVSLRRPREDEAEEYGDEAWRLSGLPAKKRRRSEREIDMVVPPSVFWDPKDRSTHHNHYPTMSISDLNHYKEYAEGKGEKFQHGQKTFDTTMQTFRSSRSPSPEQKGIRARSEPIGDDGRRIMMKRDERKLGEDLAERMKVMKPHRPASRDSRLPVTQRGSKEPVTTIEHDTSTSSGNTLASAFPPSDDFQPPKRILAKLLATPDSCLPTLALNVTEHLTSWGRGFKNTIRFANGHETRFPKYAFKILLFKPDCYNVDEKSDPNDHEMTFYVSSKATYGIKINGVQLPSANHQDPQTPSRYWTELRHGDILNVWWHDSKPEKIFTRFKFECYWGKSKKPRTIEEPVQLLPEGELLAEIENVCLAQEKTMLEEIDRREEEDQKIREQEKQARKNEALRQVEVNQSFTGRTASAT